ncbi:MHYT domain-containing protein [Streptomyces sp. NPDC047097]|uniref:MHYT domain-containing protein n=1 Tax=Streptomyces sp. NPDC047097 TaxID=3155260 RepID=UPI00340C66BF
MEGTVEGFRYGLTTPAAGFLLACLGGFLLARPDGLLATRAARPGAGADRVRLARLLLGATTLGCGIWAAQVVALTGFGVAGAPVGRDPLTTAAGLAVAVATAGVGLFVAGHRGPGALSLATGGTIIGLGIAATHYLGMAGLRLAGSLGYATGLVALSVVVAAAAATLALRAAVSTRGRPASATAAALGTGAAVTGMHHIGLAAVTVTMAPDTATSTTAAAGATPVLITALLAGPVLFLLVAGVAAVRGRRVPDGGRPGHRAPDGGDPLRLRGIRPFRTGSAGPGRSGACAAGGAHSCRLAAWPVEIPAEPTEAAGPAVRRRPARRRGGLSRH